MPPGTSQDVAVGDELEEARRSLSRRSSFSVMRFVKARSAALRFENCRLVSSLRAVVLSQDVAVGDEQEEDVQVGDVEVGVVAARSETGPVFFSRTVLEVAAGPPGTGCLVSGVPLCPGPGFALIVCLPELGRAVEVECEDLEVWRVE